jgi:flavin-binding protein dodecin
MSGNTYKMSTLIGESPESIEAAVLTALSTSAKKVRGQEWCQVTDIRANVNEGGGVDRWQVEVKVAFEVDDA